MAANISRISIGVLPRFSASMEKHSEQVKRVSWGLTVTPAICELAKYTRILELIISCVV
jgi:hypothetical protein